MKKFVVSIIIFVVLTSLIVFHSIVMYRFGEEADKTCENIQNHAMNQNWEEVKKELMLLDSLWEKKRTWAALTVRTTIIEEIDISLEQSKIYAEIKKQPEFLGEFIMLKGLMRHIPHQEGLHIEEIL